MLTEPQFSVFGEDPKVCKPILLGDDCIVLYLRLFSNMGDKTHPFTICLYDTFMQKVKQHIEIKVLLKNRV